MKGKILSVAYPVKNEVFLVGATELRQAGLNKYLESIGTTWTVPEGVSGQSALVEVYGRLCYRSFDESLNPNVTKIRHDHTKYIENVLASRHGSIFEHVWLNFIIAGATRTFTHELVRHRVGTAFSQESMRYVRFSETMPYVLPECMNDSWGSALFQEEFDRAVEIQQKIVDHYGVDQMDFHGKKTFTSAARGLIGHAVGTVIGVSFNIRSLRHVLELRTAEGVEAEFVEIANKLGDVALAEWPIFFGDFAKTDIPNRNLPALVPKWSKV